MKSLTVIFLTTICLIACSTAGTRGLDDPQTMRSIVEKKTTQIELQTLLGDPSSMHKDGSGGTVWHYHYGKSQFLLGGEVISATFRFNKDGVLVEKSVMRPRY